MKTIIFVVSLIITAFPVKSQGTNIVQLAKLQIDSAHLDEYKSLLKEGMETALKTEPGVLTLYAMYETEHPTHVTVLEVYADDSAYKMHIASPHFQRYKTATLHMVKSLEIVRVKPFSGALRKNE